MKLTKSKLKQIIKEEMQKALRESEDEYNVGEFVVVEISDDRYGKDIEKIDKADVESHISGDKGRGPYLSAKFLAEIIHVSQGKYEPISEANVVLSKSLKESNGLSFEETMRLEKLKDYIVTFNIGPNSTPESLATHLKQRMEKEPHLRETIMMHLRAAIQGVKGYEKESQIARKAAQLLGIDLGQETSQISEAPLNETQPKPQEVDQMEELMYVLFNPKGAIRKFYKNLPEKLKPSLIQNLKMYAERHGEPFHEYLKIFQTEGKSK